MAKPFGSAPQHFTGPRAASILRLNSASQPTLHPHDADGDEKDEGSDDDCSESSSSSNSSSSSSDGSFNSTGGGGGRSRDEVRTHSAPHKLHNRATAPQLLPRRSSFHGSVHVAVELLPVAKVDGYIHDGDEGFDAPVARATRAALRDQPPVVAALRRFSETFEESARAGPDCFHRNAVMHVLMLACKALWPPELFSLAAASAAVSKDWRRETGGATTMTRHHFEESLFELADIWTDDLLPATYAAFLDDLYRAITGDDAQPAGAGAAEAAAAVAGAKAGAAGRPGDGGAGAAAGTVLRHHPFGDGGDSNAAGADGSSSATPALGRENGARAAFSKLQLLPPPAAEARRDCAKDGGVATAGASDGGDGDGNSCNGGKGRASSISRSPPRQAFKRRRASAFHSPSPPPQAAATTKTAGLLSNGKVAVGAAAIADVIAAAGSDTAVATAVATATAGENEWDVMVTPVPQARYKWTQLRADLQNVLAAVPYVPGNGGDSAAPAAAWNAAMTAALMMRPAGRLVSGLAVVQLGVAVEGGGGDGGSNNGGSNNGSIGQRDSGGRPRQNSLMRRSSGRGGSIGGSDSGSKTARRASLPEARSALALAFGRTPQRPDADAVAAGGGECRGKPPTRVPRLLRCRHDSLGDDYSGGEPMPRRRRSSGGDTGGGVGRPCPTGPHAAGPASRYVEVGAGGGGHPGAGGTFDDGDENAGSIAKCHDASPPPGARRASRVDAPPGPRRASRVDAAAEAVLAATPSGRRRSGSFSPSPPRRQSVRAPSRRRRPDLDATDDAAALAGDVEGGGNASGGGGDDDGSGYGGGGGGEPRFLSRRRRERARISGDAGASHKADVHGLSPPPMLRRVSSRGRDGMQRSLRSIRDVGGTSIPVAPLQ
ncbi:unnamed protein product [Phaeothamnion confervicola]